MKDDVEIRLTSGVGDPGRVITPDTLRNMNRDIRRKLRSEMKKLAQFLKGELIFNYQKALRVEGRQHSGQLWQKMQQAMEIEVGGDASNLWMHVFDLAFMDRATRNQGKGTSGRGWFLLYEDGRIGRGHGSNEYTFVAIDEAEMYARDCADHFRLDESEKAEWLAHVAKVFAGRYGEGIMVNNNRPLFYRFPSYGSPDGKPTTAGRVLANSGHPGYYAWNVLEGVGGAMSPRGNYSQSRDGWLYDVVQNAVDSVLKERYGN